MHHHRDCDLDNDTADPASWNRASYTPDILAEIGEPLAEKPNDYRKASLHFCRIMFCVDEFTTTASDARLGVIVVAIVLKWPSVRGLTVTEIAEQIGCSPLTLTRSISRFKTMAGLDSNGAMQGIRPGAGSSNGDKPAAVQSREQYSLRAQPCRMGGSPGGVCVPWFTFSVPPTRALDPSLVTIDNQGHCM
jgi:hypothetical protein